MNNFKEILALIKLADNKIEGRIKFQKSVYILKNHGVNFTEKFTYHYFGPYSFDLQLEIEELIYQGRVKEESSNPYIYKIDEEFIDEIDENILKDKEKLIRHLVKQDASDLELLATIYYLFNNNLKETHALKNKLSILKPHLEDRIESAFLLYEDLNNNIFN